MGPVWIDLFLSLCKAFMYYS